MSERTGHQPYRIGVLLFAFGHDGKLLLIKRSKKPNRGMWCAAGGKLEMSQGESPYECAAREAREEIGVELKADDLNLKCILSETNYEDSGHWLMFVFVVKPIIESLPEPIDEGVFGFFSREELDGIEMPQPDEKIIRETIFTDDGARLSVLRVDGFEPLISESLIVEEELF